MGVLGEVSKDTSAGSTILNTEYKKKMKRVVVGL